jgi:hypothetical protein
MPINAQLAVTVIPLLCLYLGLIAWLTYDASQDSNWFVWLLLFLFAGPVTIPLYLIASRLARRSTSQARLDALADGKRTLGSEFKFGSEIDRAKWMQDQDPTVGTMFEPSLGLSLRSDRHVIKFSDPYAEELLARGDEAGALRYLLGMYAIATEQGDLERQAGIRALVGAKITRGVERLQYWERTGEDLPVDAAAPKPTSIQPPKVRERKAPF